MRRLSSLYRRDPLALARHAWLVLAVAAVLTFVGLPYAQMLHHGAHPLAGLLLHHSLVALFLLAALMAALALLLRLRDAALATGRSPGRRSLDLIGGALIALPAVLAGCGAALLLLNATYLGLALQ